MRSTTVRLDPTEVEAVSVEVAKLVEQELIAKASKFLLANLGVLLALLLGGASAYWHLDKRVDQAIAETQTYDRRMTMIVVESNGFRQAVDLKLDTLNAKVDEVNRFLRDHAVARAKRDAEVDRR